MKPVDLDLYFNHETETALHVAVRNRSHAIASHLLAAGALPNLNSQVGILCGLEYHVCSIFIHQSLAGSQPSTPGSGEGGSERKSSWGLQGRQASCGGGCFQQRHGHARPPPQVWGQGHRGPGPCGGSQEQGPSVHVQAPGS